ncbi:ABC transporter permease [Virgibacillus sp. MSJ-26]|uniref:ABC transporter permease n=1 Tax=Virgibacillus sp. MSJ-26 TaxID=2841522 RepID=UPI001C10FAB6|nr:ABC transporter permease [Virgibacillus sp. MSJ-26]MBU5467020.1 ABC transporter permease [Virgibacillus sp. MSJ-26]
MQIVREINIFFVRKLKESIRQMAWVISGLMTPFLYILLFSPLLKKITRPAMSTAEVLDMFVPGILVLLAFGSGMGAGWLMVFDLNNGIIERLRVTPASRFAMLMGGVLKDVVAFIVPAIIVLVISSLFGYEIHFVGILLQLLLLSILTMMVSAWSGSIGLLLQDVGGVAAVVTSLQLPLTLLAGILLPISFGPKWLQVLAHFNPLYYGVEASKELAAGSIVNQSVFIGFLVIVIITIITLAWSTRVYNKAVA